MDKKSKIREASWYPTAVAVCIGVVLFVLLTRLPSVLSAIGAFVGFFMPVIIGCVIAYVVNPLTVLLEKVFRFVKKEKTRRVVSNVLSFVFVILFIVFAALILIPQLVESIATFMENWDSYVDALDSTVKSWGVAEDQLDVKALLSPSEDGTNLVSLLKDNMESIITVSAGAGKSFVNLLLGFILSIYLLADKKNLTNGTERLIKAVLGEKRYPGFRAFLTKSNVICSRYIVFNIIDSLIVGLVNALVMTVFGMEYAGLVSFVVGVTNLIPTFGPVIGLAVGAFVLLMVNPLHALIFVIATLVLQGLDGYVIKPRLFGNSLGVSGLWIMIGVIVGGNMFGVTGILISIPFVAILDNVYRTYLLPALEKKKA